MTLKISNYVFSALCPMVWWITLTESIAIFPLSNLLVNRHFPSYFTAIYSFRLHFSYCALKINKEMYAYVKKVEYHRK